MQRLLFTALLLGLCAVALFGTGCKEEKVSFSKVGTIPKDK